MRRLRTWVPGVWRAGGPRPGRKVIFDEAVKGGVKTSISGGVQRYTGRRRYIDKSKRGRYIKVKKPSKRVSTRVQILG